jgi:hypothetical protein
MYQYIIQTTATVVDHEIKKSRGSGKIVLKIHEEGGKIVLNLLARHEKKKNSTVNNLESRNYGFRVGVF